MTSIMECLQVLNVLILANLLGLSSSIEMLSELECNLDVIVISLWVKLNILLKNMYYLKTCIY